MFSSHRLPQRGNILSSLPTPPRRARKRILAFNTNLKTPTRPTGDIQPLVQDEDMNLGILCVNCHLEIPETEIDEHTKTCWLATQLRDLQQSKDPIENLKRKFLTFKNSLERMMIQQSFSLSDQNILKILIKKAGELASVANLEQSTQMSSSIKQLQGTYRGGNSVKLYIERLTTLSGQLTSFLEQIKIQQDKKEILNLQGKINQCKRNSSVKKTLFRRDNLVKLNMAKLQEINSEVTSKYSQSNLDSLSSALGLDLPEDVEQTGEEQDGETQDLCKYFYSLCLQAKLRYPQKDPAQMVNMARLYEGVKQENCKVSDWPAFIEEALRNPQRWSLKNVRNRRMQPRNRNFQYFDTITEED